MTLTTHNGGDAFTWRWFPPRERTVLMNSRHIRWRAPGVCLAVASHHDRPYAMYAFGADREVRTDTDEIFEIHTDSIGNIICWKDTRSRHVGPGAVCMSQFETMSAIAHGMRPEDAFWMSGFAMLPLENRENVSTPRDMTPRLVTLPHWSFRTRD